MISGLLQISRLTRAGYVLVREGALAIADGLPVPAVLRPFLRVARFFEKRSVAEHSRVRRLTDAFNRLGPSYIKLGQFLATRRDVVGAEIANDLEHLQDKLAPFEQDKAIKQIEEALEAPLGDLFQRFDAPVAAASIAQVHSATLVVNEGDAAHAVAVKVLRPAVRRRFARDLETYYFTARMAERFVPDARRLKPVAVVDTLARSVEMEMDLRLEAAALSEFAENTADDPGFRVPKVYWTHTSRNVLTMEWIDGIRMSDVAALRAAGHDLKQLGATLIQSFLRHAMRDGFFHADMHQGNLFVDADGRIAAVDFGITGRLPHKDRRFLAEILYGFITRNYRRVAEVHFEAGYVPADQSIDDFAQALRAIGEPLQDKRADEISMGRVLAQLFQVTELFAMQTQTQLIMLQKTMVVVEGVARTLDPSLNMWNTAEPVVREWMESELGAAGRLSHVAEGAQSLGKVMGDFPTLLMRAERASEYMVSMAEHGVRLDRDSIQAIASSHAKAERWGQRAQWVIAVSLAAIALHLWIS